MKNFTRRSLGNPDFQKKGENTELQNPDTASMVVPKEVSKPDVRSENQSPNRTSTVAQKKVAESKRPISQHFRFEDPADYTRRTPDAMRVQRQSLEDESYDFTMDEIPTNSIISDQSESKEKEKVKEVVDPLDISDISDIEKINDSGDSVSSRKIFGSLKEGFESGSDSDVIFYDIFDSDIEVEKRKEETKEEIEIKSEQNSIESSDTLDLRDTPEKAIEKAAEAEAEADISEQSESEEKEVLDPLDISDIKKINDSVHSVSSRKIFGSLKEGFDNGSAGDIEVEKRKEETKEEIEIKSEENSIESSNTLDLRDTREKAIEKAVAEAAEKRLEEEIAKPVAISNDPDNIAKNVVTAAADAAPSFFSSRVKLLSLGAIGITFFAFAGVTLNSLISFLLTATVLIVAKEGMNYLRSENPKVSNLTTGRLSSEPERGSREPGLGSGKTFTRDFERKRGSASNSFASKSDHGALKKNKLT